ncbi:hypothetical protein Pcac1_g17165 [Phytophthora cactorum]|nr:hypothetical protein Pcac1_g17165 [Phytophthora cactorum]
MSMSNEFRASREVEIVEVVNDSTNRVFERVILPDTVYHVQLVVTLNPPQFLEEVGHSGQPEDISSIWCIQEMYEHQEAVAQRQTSSN